MTSVLLWSVFSTIGYFIEQNDYILKISEIDKTKFDNPASGNVENKFEIFLFLLGANLKGWLVIVLLGPMSFGSFTFINLCINSLYTGYLLKLTSVAKILIVVLPHGIFEIPAIIIAGAAGFKIPYEVIRYLAGRKEVILTREDIKEYLTLALISVILIVIATWIEANITIEIVKSLNIR
jgi:uncharacterized membrane protein SpoIIM required for sporulation